MEPTKRILIVEDDKYLRDLYVELLKGAEYSVEEASDGEEGYSKAFQGGYDLILLDLMLPKMDGIQILSKLQDGQAKMPNKAVVILTSVGQDDTIAKGISLGARGYLLKSDYNPAQLLKELQNYL
jgi:DNA-binding response OmpR family regulator